MKRFIILAILVALVGCKGSESPQEIPSVEDIALAPPFPAFEEMVGISPVIFSGIVSAIHYGEHGHSPYPFTFVTFSGVDFTRKDSEVPLGRDNTLEVSYMGGILDDLTIIETDEFPKFELGERYLIFLRGGGWRLSPIAANTGGVFKLGRLFLTITNVIII